MWGPDPLLYDTTVFSKPPESWAALWDPKLRGKISMWDDISTIYLAAQVLGYDRPDPAALYNFSDEQLQKTKQKLIELKPNIRKYWSTGGELTNLFQNHEVVAAVGWPLMTNQLRKLRFPIGETIPKENTTGWINHLMITAASEHNDLAHEFLAYLVEARTQKGVTEVTGYAPANPRAAQFMSEEEKKNLHLDDVDNYMAQIYFWQHVPRRDKYSAGRVQPSGAAPFLEIRSVNKSFGGRVVLREISLAVTQGEFLTILGESGSGKTTLLRLSAGFEPPDAGEIWMGGERLDPLPPFRRRVNTVFQHYALFPHLSVFENVAYGLWAQKAPRLEIPRRVEDALAMVKMTEFARHPPGRLSGGQQRRVGRCDREQKGGAK